MSKEKAENRTVEELKDVLNHLDYYEVWMLRSLTNILVADNQGQGMIHNALVESFLIHARILIEFLYKDEPYKDDVRASQYFTPDDFWKSIRPPKTELLEKTVNDAHKLLAHLTYTRLQGKKQWPFIEIVNDIEVVLQVFRKNLPKDFIKESNITLYNILGGYKMNEPEMEMWKEKNRRELAQYNAEVMSDLEIFKSVILSGQNSLKSVILINGGAAVALLAFIGNIWNKSTDNIAIKKLLVSMVLFVGGVLLGGIATGLTYLVQLSYKEQKNKLGLVLNIMSNILVTFSYIIFGIASIFAFVAFWFRFT